MKTDKPENTLIKWLESNGVRQCTLAERLDVDRSTVTLWVKGRRRPWRKHAAKLAEVTNGAVPAEIWKVAA